MTRFVLGSVLGDKIHDNFAALAFAVAFVFGGLVAGWLFSPLFCGILVGVWATNIYFGYFHSVYTKRFLHLWMGWGAVFFTFTYVSHRLTQG